eukprot:gene4521-biopygen4452
MAWMNAGVSALRVESAVWSPRHPDSMTTSADTSGYPSFSLSSKFPSFVARRENGRVTIDPECAQSQTMTSRTPCGSLVTSRSVKWSARRIWNGLVDRKLTGSSASL